MTASTSSVSPLRQRMLNDMRMRKLPPRPRLAIFAAHLKRSPDTAIAEKLRLYQLYMIDRGTSALSVAYGVGLRVSEVCALKVSDIDSQRMALRIEQGNPPLEGEGIVTNFNWK